MKNVSTKPMGSMSARRVSLRQVGNRLIVTERPKRTEKVTERSEKARGRFLDAVYYASRQIDDPATNALYAKGITEKKRSAYAVALCDFLVAPEVESIDTIDYRGNVGDPVAIRAKDDFMVTRVKVQILDSAGTLIEEGDAVTDESARMLWKYVATAANATPAGTTVRATAFDKPGNVGSLEKVI